MRRDTEWELTGLWFVWLAILVIALMSLSCAKPTPTPAPEGPRGAINCASETVRHHWPTAYPEVMRCLTAIMESPMSCLDAIPTAVAVTLDVVACIARGAHIEAARASEHNPDDEVSARKASRAAAWIKSRGFSFAD